MSARVFTIPPGEPFVDRLAGAILSGDLPVRGGAVPGILDIARYTILVPTRRAQRSLNDAFLRAGQPTGSLLPRIRPIGDVDEEELIVGGTIETASFGNTGDASISAATANALKNLHTTRPVRNAARTINMASLARDAAPWPSRTSDAIADANTRFAGITTQR